MAVDAGSACVCGAALPWHLFRLGMGLEHVCGCERAYREEGGVVVLLEERQVNPFARYDRGGPPPEEDDAS